jgi:hypothetical protein
LDDPNGVLESWIGDDFCRWSDVLWDSHSGRVVNLILNMNQGNNSEYMSGTISESIRTIVDSNTIGASVFVDSTQKQLIVGEKPLVSQRSVEYILIFVRKCHA